MITMKDGTQTEDIKLGRLIQFDERSRSYNVRTVLPSTELRVRRWTGGPVLDQGYEGSCVGHAWAKELLLRPVANKGIDDAFARRVYCRAQAIDPWPGTSKICTQRETPHYEGTSILAGAKAVQEAGYIESYYWAFNVDDVLAAISNLGPVVIGIPWYDGMYDTRKSGLVEVSGRVVGGHAIVLTGHHPRMRIKGEGWTARHHVVEWINSWGYGYGLKGRGLLKVEDLERLLKDNGEACIPTGRLRVKA
jgi:hypothetical protein